METTTLSFENMHNHGDLLVNLFRARSQSALATADDQANWDLPDEDELEYDQYDTPASRWIAIHNLGEVYAGIRLTPTTARCGIYSYMIRDAQMGLLDAVPGNLLYEKAPVDPNTWECTRVFVSRSVPQRLRRRVHSYMVGAMLKAAREQGATRLIALTASNWPQLFGRCGLTAKAIGPKLFIDDGDYQCVSIDLTEKMH